MDASQKVRDGKRRYAKKDDGTQSKSYISGAFGLSASPDFPEMQLSTSGKGKEEERELTWRRTTTTKRSL